MSSVAMTLCTALGWEVGPSSEIRREQDCTASGEGEDQPGCLENALFSEQPFEIEQE